MAKIHASRPPSHDPDQPLASAEDEGLVSVVAEPEVNAEEPEAAPLEVTPEEPKQQPVKPTEVSTAPPSRRDATSATPKRTTAPASGQKARPTKND